MKKEIEFAINAAERCWMFQWTGAHSRSKLRASILDFTPPPPPPWLLPVEEGNTCHSLLTTDFYL